MVGSEFFNASFWWVCPIVMIALCFFIMRRRTGMRMCGFGSRERKYSRINVSDSALDILDKLYAIGEVGKEAYEEKKRVLSKQRGKGEVLR